jgi:hypothetical protein
MKALGLGILIIFLIIAIALVSLALSKVKGAKAYRKPTLLYLLITALCFGIAGISGFYVVNESIFYYYIHLQAMILILGILHAILLYSLIKWTDKTKFLWEFLYTLAIVFLGIVVFLLTYKHLLRVHVLQYQVLTAVTWFFVPFLFARALERFRMIPARIFRKWFYPVGQEINDPLDSELVSLLVISFVFHKKLNDPEITTFRAKAPSNMEFGRLFYYFVNDYNDRHREGPIEFLDQENHPHGWIFYHKPSWFRKKRYIDPEKIIKVNRIRENSVIICQRIKEEKL